MKTKVLIIGAGPSGLMLSLILHNNNIDNIILEKQSSEHVANRIRAGILEPATVELLKDVGVGERVSKEGIKHRGFNIAFDDKIFSIDLQKLSNNAVTVYGQTEITKDLMHKLKTINAKIFYNVENIKITNIESTPSTEYTYKACNNIIRSEFIVGCDGYHGITKNYIPNNIKKVYEKEFNFSWLGLLSNTKPISKELIYINNKDGFALCSMRSNTRSRYYIQCSNSEKLKDWSDDRFWECLHNALPVDIKNNLKTGPSIEKSIAKLRSYVLEPMSYKKIFIAGDAAHIVPPTGAKGLNLALADIKTLSQGFKDYYKKNSEDKLKEYSQNCLKRVWKTQIFSMWFTKILHSFPNEDQFTKKIKYKKLHDLFLSNDEKRRLAKSYIGEY